MRAMQRLSCQKVDAVFADTDTISGLADFLDRRKLNTKLWLLSHHGEAIPGEITGYDGILSWPITEQKLRNALL